MFTELKLKFGYMGNVDHKKVCVLDLFEMLKAAKTSQDYKICLDTMNLFYNFGVKLKHRELASRLLSAAMLCREEAEAVELIKLYGAWLEHPPDTNLIYAVMGHYLDAGEPLVVREIAKAVREDWRIRPEAPLYLFAIEAMLRLEEDPVGEAMLLHQDAHSIGLRLPAPLHTRLLDEALRVYEAEVSGAAKDSEGTTKAEVSGAAEDSNRMPEAEVSGAAEDSNRMPEAAQRHLCWAVQAADGLSRDGHLRGGANAATLCSLSWLFWHVSALGAAEKAKVLAEAAPQGAFAFMDASWARVLEAAIENFGCHWGFAPRLPKGLFAALEASEDPEALRLLQASRARFGRFLP